MAQPKKKAESAADVKEKQEATLDMSETAEQGDTVQTDPSKPTWDRSTNGNPPRHRAENYNVV